MESIYKAGVLLLIPGQFMVEVPTAKSPQTSSLLLGEAVPMPTLPLPESTNIVGWDDVPMLTLPAKVEEALTIIPTAVLVGLMALAEAKFQLLGVISEAFCQEEFPRLSVAVRTKPEVAPEVSLTWVVWMPVAKVEVAVVP